MLSLKKNGKMLKGFGSVAMAVCALGVIVLSANAQQIAGESTSVEIAAVEYVSTTGAVEITASVQPTGTTTLPVPDWRLPIMFESVATVGTATLPPGTVTLPALVRYLPIFEAE